MTKIPLQVSAGTCDIFNKSADFDLDFDPLFLDFETGKPRGKVKRHSEQLSCYSGRPKRTQKIRGKRPRLPTPTPLDTESSDSPSPTPHQGVKNNLVNNYTLDPIPYINQLPPIEGGDSSN
uniref:Uncharacterized protein n=1 Tax=Tanacetum cinerariifolium TaxID=118510 RepID=A0A6L2NUL1_TANCI|nr:hypothetical protein [Tanacetum cinerariifolium]